MASLSPDPRFQQGCTPDSTRSDRAFEAAIDGDSAATETVSGADLARQAKALVAQLSGLEIPGSDFGTSFPRLVENAEGQPDCPAKCPTDGVLATTNDGQLFGRRTLLDTQAGHKSPDRQDAAQQLNAILDTLARRLERTESALRCREAQLAAAVPVIERPDETEHLARRLEALLRLAAQITQAEAAALYLLDDTTSQLKLRAVWNLAPTHFLQSARPLAGQFVDLEALLGHAVVLHRGEEMAGWRMPVSAESAVCLPVSTPSVPLGTLWVFAKQHRSFNDQQLELLEVVAGRIATELERHVLLRSAAEWSSQHRQLQSWADQYERQLPTQYPLLDRWHLAATHRRRTDALPRELYDWGVLPDGRAFLVVGGCPGPTPLATARAMALRAAVHAHLAYVTCPARLLTSLNETLWEGSTGDWHASLLCAVMDDSCGEMIVAAAGELAAWISKGGATRRIALACPPLGVQQRLSVKARSIICSGPATLWVAGPSITKRFWTSVSQRPNRRLALPSLAVAKTGRTTAETSLSRWQTLVERRLQHVPCDEVTLAVAVHYPIMDKTSSY